MLYANKGGHNMNKVQARKFLSEIDKLLKTLHIRYFLMGGTLLGAVREHDFIVDDNDIDLGFFDEEFQPNKERIRKVFIDNNFSPVGWKRNHTGQIRGLNINKILGDGKRLHCCLLSFKKRNKYRYYHYNKSGDAKVLPANKLENLKFINFLNLRVLVPKDFDSILTYMYGSSWQSIKHRLPHRRWAKQDINKRYNKFVKKAKNKDIFWWAQ